MITKATIQRINEEARIDEVVGEYVTLKKRGSSLIGNCPFHNEKTPSFHVSVAKGIFKCFGCGKAGNSVNFLMEHAQMSYVEALKYLAKKYNIEVEEEFQTEEQIREEQEKHSLQESMLIATATAQKFFSDYLINTDEGKIGLAYFLERGFSKAIIDKFQLGFAPSGGETFTQFALSKGFNIDILKKAGLTSNKENSKFDFFRNRVMFPIQNMMGQVIGFGGRILKTDEKSPKYINTPESDIYNKSKVLYGISFAKNDIRKKDECLLTEGYTDVISLVQAGVENVVASSGTALTTDQIKLIKRLTLNVTILYDGDAAGLKAALRSTDMLLEEGLNVRVVLLPEPEDPDSYVRKIGASAFMDYVAQQKKDVILFKTSLLAEEVKNDPIKKADLIKDIIASISKVPDAIHRSVYVKECAELLQVPEQLLITETNKIRRKKIREETNEPQIDQAGEYQDTEKLQNELAKPIAEFEQKNISVLEKEIARMLIEYGTWQIATADGKMETVAQYLIEELEEEHFSAEYQPILNLAKNNYSQGIILPTQAYLEAADEAIMQLAISLTISPFEANEKWEKKLGIELQTKEKVYPKDIHSVLTRYKLFKTIATIKEVEGKLKEENDENTQMKLLKFYQQLLAQKKTFADLLGNVVYKPNI